MEDYERKKDDSFEEGNKEEPLQDDTKVKVPLADLEDQESLREAGLLDDLEVAETDVDAAMLNNAVPPQSELEDRYSSRSSRKPEGLETLGTGEREWVGEAARWEGVHRGKIDVTPYLEKNFKQFFCLLPRPLRICWSSKYLTRVSL